MTQAGMQGPKGGLAPVTRRVMNLATFLAQSAARLPQRPALICDDAPITWAQLETRVQALARAFEARGLGKGDRVLIHSSNCCEMLEAMLATFRIGAVWVPTNFRITPDEVAYLASSAGVSAFICHADFPEHARLADSIPGLKLYARIGQADFAPTSIDELAQEGARHAAGGAAHQAARVDYDDPCWFFFTSGTTGKPKAAVLTHGQMAFVITNHICDLMPGLSSGDASLVVAPLSHGAGIHFLTQLARGAATVFSTNPRFSVEAAWAAVEKYRISNFFTVPTILNMMVGHESVDRYDHSSLSRIIYAGAPMYREDQKRALDKLGPVLVQYYGLGEVTGNITVLPPSEHAVDDAGMAKAGSCGYARTGMQVSIQDSSGRELGPHETGEICVCGPAVFAGYYDNPEANRKSFRDGWFRTGDLGHMDEQGYVYITGRESDMYISGGSNIYPREIEEKVLGYGGIKEVCVLGVPHPKWGEVGVMVCVLQEPGLWDEPAFRTWLDGNVARYKHPRKIVVWPELPKSGYGKITKKMVYQELEKRGQLSVE
jgi:acyl-CoA synthetase (AMP-forming)/AMP-acid ligase II